MYTGLRLSTNYRRWITDDVRALDSAAIDAYCRRYAIDIVIPADVDSVFLLARLKHEVTEALVFPVPDPETLALLNNKWHFMQWLEAQALPCPASQLVAGDAQIENLDLAFPMIAKPLEENGGRGVDRIDSVDKLRAYMENHRAKYRLPFLLQEFVPGSDLVFGVVADRGRINAWTIQKYHWKSGKAEFIDHPELLQLGEKILSALNYTGIAEFDVRVDADDQRPRFIECNPRLWMSIDKSLWVGVDFVEAGIALARGGPTPAMKQESGFYMWPEAIFKDLVRLRLRPSDLSPASRRGLAMALADPIPGMCVWALRTWPRVRNAMRRAVRPVRPTVYPAVGDTQAS
jgi:glutathione synthase/RimK-type ligase-like ATP-grasp enzyme